MSRRLLGAYPATPPALGRLVADGYDFDMDALFESGLQRLFDGISVLVE